MSNLESALEELKKTILEMAELVSLQIKNCKLVIEDNDSDLAEEVISMDKRINAMELKIDRDCENILALYNPVATDLRFVLAALKTNHDLERIGDNIRGIARASDGVSTKKEAEMVRAFRIYEMFDTVEAIISDVCNALEHEDTKLARKIFKKDAKLDKIEKKSMTVAHQLLSEHPEKAKPILSLYTIVKKLERIGDLSTNLGEEIIFHIEAKVLKHKKKVKKDEKKGDA
ncbi:MAG: phosphate signaling complex protein PhoU [Cyclobacteriaceae bacterium]|nr:phosphate signaling complex protein PhoU [Cyclobacteriaceae bacterium]